MSDDMTPDSLPDSTLPASPATPAPTDESTEDHQHQHVQEAPTKYLCRPRGYTDEEYEAVGIHLIERWPDHSEIGIPKNVMIASIKEALLRRDYIGAADRLLNGIFDPAIQTEWALLIDLHVIQSLMGFVRGVRFTTDLTTSDINLINGLVRINPIFFLRFIHDFENFVELLLHERDHCVLRTLYGLDIYWRRGKIGPAEANIAEDCYIQARLRHYINNRSMMGDFHYRVYVENLRVAKALANNRLQEKRTPEDLEVLVEQVLPSYPTNKRLLLTTDKFASFNGKIVDRNILSLLRNLQDGRHVHYPAWVDAWARAFPLELRNNDGIVISICGHGHDDDDAEPMSVPVQSDHEDEDEEFNEDDDGIQVSGSSSGLSVKTLPISENPLLDEAFAGTFDPNDALRHPLATTVNHVRWSQFLGESFISDILTHDASNPVYQAQSFIPRVTRGSSISLGNGYLPVWYEHSFSLGVVPREFVLYVDVSGSMDAYYGLVGAICAQLEEKCQIIKQFSTTIVSVPQQNRKLYTTGGTDYDIVAQDILDNQYERVIIVTDNTCNIDEELRGRLIENRVEINLISTTDANHSALGFNALAVRRVDLPGSHG